MPIAYRSGYKYQLAETYSIVLTIQPEQRIVTDFIRFDLDGTLTISKGYAWDGPSGPAIDTPDFMRGSLIHDAIYELIRDGHLHDCRAEADDILRMICLQDGMPRARAEWVHNAVRVFGGSAVRGKKPIFTAGV